MSLHELVTTDDRDQAIRSAVRLCGVQFNAPAAAWQDLPGGHAAVLHASYGFDTDSKPVLEGELGLAASSNAPTGDLRALRRRFGTIAGRCDAMVLRARSVFILVASNEADPEPPLGLEPLVSQTFDLVEEASLARKRTENLDMSLALTAHELRGPLLSVKAALETSLIDEDASSRGAALDRGTNLTAQLLTRAHRELGSLAETCETLLFWAVDDRSLEFDAIGLSKTMQTAMRACSHERNYHAIVFEPPENEVRMPGSPKHLRVAFSNLIRNALYYSPPGEPVEIEIEQLTNHVRISVADKGPGVPMDQCKSIFDPFVRGLGNMSPRSGRGLGLFIAKRVIEGHRGRIWVDSRGRGAKFVVELPRTKESA
ncbi:MAG: sensor histidine kinase [Actinomycetota bacterium]